MEETCSCCGCEIPKGHGTHWYEKESYEVLVFCNRHCNAGYLQSIREERNAARRSGKWYQIESEAKSC